MRAGTAGTVLALAFLAGAPPTHGGGAEAPDATCWNFFQNGQWDRLCYESTIVHSADQACVPSGDFQVCVAGSHQTSTTCALPTSPSQVTCTTRYLGFAVGNGTLPGTARALAETWGDANACSWPDALRRSPFECATGTFASRTVTVAKGTCVETPRAVWRAEAAGWFSAEAPARTAPLEAWSTTCAW